MFIIELTRYLGALGTVDSSSLALSSSLFFEIIQFLEIQVFNHFIRDHSLL